MPKLMPQPLLTVETPGLLSTIQDLGRTGYQCDGMVVSGAMDSFAAQVANILVGNPRGAPILEITLRGPTLHIRADILIAICGADLTARADDVPLPLWKSVTLRTGQTLSFGMPRSGTRACIAVFGGFAVPLVLDSASTYLRGGLGGFHGRSLRAGDVLMGRPLAFPIPGRALAESEVPDYRSPALARLILGPHIRAFAQDGAATLFAEPYSVTPRSDRMGYRLEGAKIAYAPGPSAGILSEPSPLGAVQIPPDGQPIVLMADRQTTGGYPVIGVVASVDLPHVAQAGPGDSISFEPISLDEAQELLIRRERFLRTLEFAASNA